MSVLAKKRIKGHRIGVKDPAEACNNLRKRLMQGVPLTLYDKQKSMLKASLRKKRVNQAKTMEKSNLIMC